MVNIYFFWGNGCPHCAKEKPFLEKLDKERDEISATFFEIYYSEENRTLLTKVGAALKTNASGWGNTNDHNWLIIDLQTRMADV